MLRARLSETEGRRTNRKKGEDMAKVIRVEVDAAGIQEIVSEWMGRSITKAKAQKLLDKLKGRAEDMLSREAFNVLSHLIDQEM